VIHKYETWSQPSDEPEIEFRGVRGEGDIERNRERATRRAKKRIRHACKSARFDRMLTLTTGEAIFDRDQFQKMIEKFIRLVRKAIGDALLYVLTAEKHDGKKLWLSPCVRSCARSSGLQAAPVCLELSRM